jgi:hypothetical protein
MELDHFSTRRPTLARTGAGLGPLIGAMTVAEAFTGNRVEAAVFAQDFPFEDQADGHDRHT